MSSSGKERTPVDDESFTKRKKVERWGNRGIYLFIGRENLMTFLLDTMLEKNVEYYSLVF